MCALRIGDIFLKISKINETPPQLESVVPVVIRTVQSMEQSSSSWTFQRLKVKQTQTSDAVRRHIQCLCEAWSHFRKCSAA